MTAFLWRLLFRLALRTEWQLERFGPRAIGLRIAAMRLQNYATDRERAAREAAQNIATTEPDEVSPETMRRVLELVDDDRPVGAALRRAIKRHEEL
jgi:hypothetical protein